MESVGVEERLRLVLKPVTPPVGFVSSLREELVAAASRQGDPRQASRRSALVAAAAVGSIISVASLVGAVAYFVTRRRTRGAAEPAGAPAG
jgi:hypothetical protein